MLTLVPKKLIENQCLLGYCWHQANPGGPKLRPLGRRRRDELDELGGVSMVSRPSGNRKRVILEAGSCRPGGPALARHVEPFPALEAGPTVRPLTPAIKWSKGNEYEEIKVHRVLPSGSRVPRIQGWLNFTEIRLATVRKSLHRSARFQGRLSGGKRPRRTPVRDQRRGRVEPGFGALPQETDSAKLAVAGPINIIYMVWITCPKGPATASKSVSCGCGFWQELFHIHKASCRPRGRPSGNQKATWKMLQLLSPLDL